MSDICEAPAPLAEGNYLLSVVLGCILRDARTGLARIVPICHCRLTTVLVHPRSLLARDIRGSTTMAVGTEERAEPR